MQDDLRYFDRTAFDKTAEVGIEATPLDSALGELETRQSEVQGKLDILARRLEPLLKVVPPVPEVDDKEIVTGHGSTVTWIRRDIAQLRQMDDMIVYLLKNLEV